jgi:hypothetical protein
MRSLDAIGSREDLANWCQPIIVDFLHDQYASHLGETHTSLRVLALSHARLWRFLILGDEDRLVTARREIIGIARLAGIKTAAVNEVDQSVLLELMDVIVARFLRTPALARSYSRVVLVAATRLASFATAAA